MNFYEIKDRQKIFSKKVEISEQIKNYLINYLIIVFYRQFDNFSELSLNITSLIKSRPRQLMLELNYD
jgi:hypothetical protein